MKKVMKIASRYEPTIADVLEAVQIGFGKNDNQHDELKNGLDDIGYRVTALEKRMGSLESTVEDAKDTLDGVARATDKDTIAILDHERRIRHLERARA